MIDVTDDALRLVPEAVGAEVIPPLIDVSLFVKLLSFIVETVSDLVTNHHADPAEVERFGKELSLRVTLTKFSG